MKRLQRNTNANVCGYSRTANSQNAYDNEVELTVFVE